MFIVFVSAMSNQSSLKFFLEMMWAPCMCLQEGRYDYYSFYLLFVFVFVLLLMFHFAIHLKMILWHYLDSYTLCFVSWKFIVVKFIDTVWYNRPLTLKSQACVKVYSLLSFEINLSGIPEFNINWEIIIWLNSHRCQKLCIGNN